LWDLLLELLAVLGIRTFRTKKDKDSESTSSEPDELNRGVSFSERATQKGVSVCAGCSRPVEKGVIHELGKDWCRDCYKSHVLKVQD
jgi:hypothetical protein